MIPPPTAVGGPTASNRHRILEEKIQSTEYKMQSTEYKIQNTTVCLETQKQDGFNPNHSE